MSMIRRPFWGFLMGILSFVSASALAQPDLSGDWLGTLRVPGQELRLAFHIEGDPGAYTAAMDSIDQGAMDIPVNTVSVVGDKVEMSVNALSAKYTGRLSSDGDSIKGTWSQGAANLPLTIERTDDVPQLKRPQEPKPPFPYKTEDVAFDNPDAPGVRLAGTLSIPEGPGPHSVLLFITGSGPQNRDEELMGHKPFLVISDYLVRNGYATLRCDDRGFGKSEGDYQSATSNDFANDALAGVEFLKSRPEIDNARIGLLGHSEGGLVAPIAATQSDDVAFMVLLAPPAVTGEEILYEQSAMILRASGNNDFIVNRSRELNEEIYTAIKNAETEDAVKEAVTAIVDEMSEFERKAFQIDQQLPLLASPWFKNFLVYDPRPTLRQVSCPVLALFGENDLQVPPDQNLDEFKTALEEGTNPYATVLELEGLNHLFQESASGSPMEYGAIEQTISPKALETITEWLDEHVKP